MSRELRLSSRYPFRKRVMIDRIGRPQLMGQTTDLSTSGMGIMLNVLIPGDEIITMHVMLTFPDAPRRIDVRARVVYSQAAEVSGWFRLGLQFVAAPAAVTALIHEFIAGQIEEAHRQIHSAAE